MKVERVLELAKRHEVVEKDCWHPGGALVRFANEVEQESSRSPGVMSAQYETVQRAEMKPDLYDGETCDQVRPRWIAEIEKEGDSEINGCIELDPETFPPGTRVLIQVPSCPDCGVNCEACDCGFDWASWRDARYS